MREPDQELPGAAAPALAGERSFAAPGETEPASSGMLDPATQLHAANAHGEMDQGLMYRIFVGPQGLRAGWSVLVFAAIFILVEVLAQGAISGRLRHIKESPTPLLMVAYEAAELLGVAAATAAMARIEGRSVLSYGYSGRRKAPHFVLGVLTGVAAISALIATLRFAGLLVFDGQMLHGFIAWQYGLKWALVFLLVALSEESLFRGYIQFTLARGMGFRWAAVVLSASFGLIHLGNGVESPVGLFSAAAIGLVACLSLWLTGSLWWAVGMHAGWDWGQSYVYGVADSGMLATGHLYATRPVGSVLWSGGTTGPEGSLCVIPVILILAGGLWLTFKPRPQEFAATRSEAA